MFTFFFRIHVNIIYVIYVGRYLFYFIIFIFKFISIFEYFYRFPKKIYILYYTHFKLTHIYLLNNNIVIITTNDYYNYNNYGRNNYD